LLTQTVITAILFAVADGEAGEAETLLVPAAADAADPDDEDTLHPEDNVRLPEDVLSAPPAEVTMVVSAAELQKALEQPGQEQQPHDLTVMHPAVVPPPEHEGETEGEELADEAGEEVEKASPLHVAIALLVIVVLAGLIVLLVLNALPR
jgi:hypothetical protein